MNFWDLLYLAVLLALAWPLARLIDAVMAGRFVLGRRLEAPLFRLAGVRALARGILFGWGIFVAIIVLIGYATGYS